MELSLKQTTTFNKLKHSNMMFGLRCELYYELFGLLEKMFKEINFEERNVV